MVSSSFFSFNEIKICVETLNWTSANIQCFLFVEIKNFPKFLCKINAIEPIPWAGFFFAFFNKRFFVPTKTCLKCIFQQYPWNFYLKPNWFLTVFLTNLILLRWALRRRNFLNLPKLKSPSNILFVVANFANIWNCKFLKAPWISSQWSVS